MKKLSSLVVLLAAVLITGTGCLKDKGFEDQKYGIQVSETKAVALIQTASSPLMTSITGQDAPVTIDGPVVTLETPNRAPGDVKLKLAYDDALVTAAGFEPLPAGSYSTTLDVTIPKDSLFVDDLVVTIENSDQLDPDKIYGIGFRIASAEGGYQVAKNMSTVVIGIAIKNKYDGIYQLDGAFYHPTSSPGYDPFTIEVELHTTSPNAVKLYVPGHDLDGYYGPGMFGGELSAFGAQEPEITIDPAINTATVQNGFDGAVTFYTMAPGYNSHYDPATKKIFVKYGYNYLPGPVFDPTRNREWTYEFTYLRPRG
jgi:hypothetical protein